MPSTSEFYNAPDWESSSGPLIIRQVAVSDIWPVGAGSEIGGGNKDTLEGGLHPFVAIGAKANRPRNEIGVVVSYTNAYLVNVNIAPGFIAKAYVANVLTYAAGSPATFDSSLALGDPVYLDDSNLAEGVTLSRSPLNSAGSDNPLVGYIWYDQDEYRDFEVGGPNASAGLPKTVSGTELEYALVSVMLA